MAYDPMKNRECSTNTADPQMLDYSEPLGRFLFLSQKGQLFALDGLSISADLSKLAPRASSTSFNAVYPLITRIRPSNVSLVVQAGEPSNAYFLVNRSRDGSGKRMRVRQDTPEIIMTALKSDRFPVVHLGELQKIVNTSQKNQSPLSLPIRYLELRPQLPDTWSAALKDVFFANAESNQDKTEVLEQKLRILRDEIKATMLEQYLSKCMWLNDGGSMLGMLRYKENNTEFVPFDTGDSQITAFVNSLEKSSEGKYIGRRDFANVISTLVKKNPWVSPTLHIYDPIFRAQHDLSEHYSLYNGLRVLCDIGAPVLLHREEGFDTTIPVVLLKPSHAGGQITQVSVREFPTRDVVWTKLEF